MAQPGKPNIMMNQWMCCMQLGCVIGHRVQAVGVQPGKAMVFSSFHRMTFYPYVQ